MIHLRPGTHDTPATALGAVLLAGLALVGCEAAGPGAGEDPDQVPGLVRDSASVRIVEFVLEEKHDLRELAADTAWYRRLEAAHGGPFDFGHLLDLDIAPDGRAALLDDMNVRVTLVDPGDGATPAGARTFGRAGEGPGELSSHGLVGLVATDTGIVVPDLQLVRVTEIDWTGEARGTRPLTERSGELVAAFDWRRHPQGGLLWRHQRMEDHRIVHRRGESVDTLLVLHLPSAGPNVLLEPIFAWDAGQGGSLAVARTDLGEVRWYEPGADAGSGASARLVRIVRWTMRAEGAEGVEGAELTRADRDHLDGLILNAMEEDGADRLPPDQVARILASMDYAERAPVLAGLFLGEDGVAWIRLAAPVTTLGKEALRVGSAAGWGGDAWILVDPERGLVDRLRIPERFTARRLAGRCLYGIAQDELGVQRPARYCQPE